MPLRIAEPEDAGAVTALLRRSYPALLAADYDAQMLVTALPYMTRAQPQLLSSGRYYIWEEDGQVAGAGGWSQDRVRGCKGHIRHVASDPAYLRRGIARALIAHSFKQAKAAGITEMECWSTRGAVGFYASMGFTILEEFEVMLGGEMAFPSVRMRADI